LFSALCAHISHDQYATLHTAAARQLDVRMLKLLYRCGVCCTRKSIQVGSNHTFRFCQIITYTCAFPFSPKKNALFLPHSFPFLSFPFLALPCLALPCLALPCLALKESSGIAAGSTPLHMCARATATGAKAALKKKCVAFFAAFGASFLRATAADGRTAAASVVRVRVLM
jgi:hypothetical protein